VSRITVRLNQYPQETLQKWWHRCGYDTRSHYNTIFGWYRWVLSVHSEEPIRVGDIRCPCLSQCKHFLTERYKIGDTCNADYLASRSGLMQKTDLRFKVPLRTLSFLFMLSLSLYIYVYIHIFFLPNLISCAFHSTRFMPKYLIKIFANFSFFMYSYFFCH